jgi:hypothetical protein
MKKRLTITFIAVASGMVGLASIIYLLEMHYHIIKRHIRYLILTWLAIVIILNKH